jgi:hypothetical protein
MTLREMISELYLDLYPNISDDNAIDERLLKFFIHRQRNLWIRNELNKDRTIDNNIIQEVTATLQAASDTLDLMSIPEGYILKETVTSIPNTIELHYSTAIARIYPIYDSGSALTKSRYTRPLKVVDFANIPFMGYGKFSTGKVFAYPMGDKIYIIEKSTGSYYDPLVSIKIKGVFENPEEVAGFSVETSRYPISEYLWLYMKNKIITDDLRPYYNPNSDRTNNSSEDVSIKTK